MDCHPDRGGSHEQMVLLNEAWELLSDLERRRQWHVALRHVTASLSVQTAAAADAQQARQQAEQYPRRWADFEAWLDRVAQDFHRAEFKRVGGWHILSSFPTAGKSVSGWLFILIGAVLGLVFLTFVLLSFVGPEFFRYSPFNFWQNSLKRILFATSVVMGGWVGAAVHQMITSAIKQSSEQSSRHDARHSEKPHQAKRQHPKTEHSGESEIIVCSSCSQKLRVPIRSSRLLVRCKKCKHEFYH